MDAIRTVFRKLLRSEQGATAIEYGLIATLIGIACIGAFQSLGGGAGGMWDRIRDDVTSAM